MRMGIINNMRMRWVGFKGILIVFLTIFMVLAIYIQVQVYLDYILAMT